MLHFIGSQMKALSPEESHDMDLQICKEIDQFIENLQSVCVGGGGCQESPFLIQ